MDNLDTASNLSDDSCHSHISSLSGLSGFEKELSDIKSFLKFTKGCLATDIEFQNEKKEYANHYKGTIKTLNTELQNCLLQVEKYKNELYTVERKTELLFHERFDKLLKKNLQLAAHLEIANDKINRLSRTNSAYKNGNTRACELEKTNLEINTRNVMLQNDVKHWKNEVDVKDLLLSEINIKIEEQNLELSTSNDVIKALKIKIVDLHKEIQAVQQNNVKLDNSLGVTSNELVSVIKLQEWYKKKLYMCRQERVKFLQDLADLRNSLAKKSRNNETAHLELSRWRNKYEESKLTALQEKERLLKDIERIESEIIGEHDRTIRVNNRGALDINMVTKQYEITVQELKDEVNSLKKVIPEQQIVIDDLQAQKTQFIAQCTTFQKLLSQKEVSTETLVNVKRELEMRLNISLENLKSRDNELLSLKYQKAEHESILHAEKSEKQQTQEAIKAVRDDFNKFQETHRKLQRDLREKYQQVAALEKEKQELSRSSSGKVKQLEQSKLQNSELLEENLSLKIDIERLTETLNCKDEQFDKSNVRKNNFTVFQEFLLENVQPKSDEIDNLSEEFRATSNYKNKIYRIKKLNTALKDKIFKFEDKDSLISSNNIEQLAFDAVLKYISAKLDELLSNNNNKACTFEESDVQIFNVSVLQKINNSLLQLCAFKDKLLDEIQQVNEHNRELKNDGCAVRKCVQVRIKKLENRCSEINARHKEFSEIIENIRDASSSSDVHCDRKELLREIRTLKTVVAVNKLEQAEKQKRYEGNNRVLLRKVKEHMRGRNSAEKRCTYLQDLHMKVADELNTLKLQYYSKECELKCLQKASDEHKSHSDKIKQTVLHSEKQPANKQTLEKFHCNDDMDLKNLVMELKDELILSKNKIKSYENDVMERNELISELKMQMQEAKYLNNSLEKVNKSYVEKIKDTSTRYNELRCKLSHAESAIEDERQSYDALDKKLLAAQNDRSACIAEFDNAKRQLHESEEKICILSEEILTLSYGLQEKAEELRSLEIQGNVWESNWCQKEANLQNLITSLQSEIKSMEQQLVVVRNEKHYFQIVSNDLKSVLQTSVDQNKVLREHLQALSSETKGYNSLPILNLPSPSRYDDTFVSQLLEKSSAIKKHKPLSDIQGCLESLKKEMACLQQRIAEKSHYTSSSG